VIAGRRQSRIWCRNTVRLSVLTAIISSPAFAKPKEDQQRFCVQTHGGEWTVGSSRPLINLRAKQIIVQASYQGSWLEIVRVRRFDPEYELSFEYKFDQDGKLQSLHGMLQRWGEWTSEANLYPDANGKITKPWIHYTGRSGEKDTPEPEDGASFAPLFTQVQVYRRVQEIPCAGLLREMEKRNATQE